MRMDGRRESQNVDDRRGMKTSTKAGLGIGGVVIAALIAMFMGGDPSQVLQQMASNTATTTEEINYVPTAEEEALATFAKQIVLNHCLFHLISVKSVTCVSIEKLDSFIFLLFLNLAILVFVKFDRHTRNTV